MIELTRLDNSILIATKSADEMIKKIIDDIIKFGNDEVGASPIYNVLDYKKKLTVIVGESKYPNKKNVGPFGPYNQYGFSEVAFLCYQKTLELFSVIGILFDSIDMAAMLITELLNNNLMDAFAKYLFYKHNVVLVNASNAIQNLDNLLAAFKNHIVLFCWGKKHHSKITSINNLSTKQTNNRFDCFACLNHPSSRSYQNGSTSTCACYMDRTFRDQASNLKIQDFKII